MVVCLIFIFKVSLYIFYLPSSQKRLTNQLEIQFQRVLRHSAIRAWLFRCTLEYELGFFLNVQSFSTNQKKRERTTLWYARRISRNKYNCLTAYVRCTLYSILERCKCVIAVIVSDECCSVTIGQEGSPRAAWGEPQVTR